MLIDFRSWQLHNWFQERLKWVERQPRSIRPEKLRWEKALHSFDFCRFSVVQLFKRTSELISARKLSSTLTEIVVLFCLPHSLSPESRQVFTPNKARKQVQNSKKLLPSLRRRSKQRIFVFQLQFSLGTKKKTVELCRYRRRKTAIIAYFCHFYASTAKLCEMLISLSLTLLF
jgi:hypothetical protein